MTVRVRVRVWFSVRVLVRVSLWYIWSGLERDIIIYYVAIYAIRKIDREHQSRETVCKTLQDTNILFDDFFTEMSFQ